MKVTVDEIIEGFEVIIKKPKAMNDQYKKVIKGKTRVSHMANKKLKTNLHHAAFNAIKLDPDLKAYYNRKVLDGKSKMSVINAVRFKLLARVVSVVKNDREYVKRTA